MDQAAAARALHRRYLTFAQHEAHGISARYEAFAEAVPTSAFATRFLLAMPPDKQQPNLLFAAVQLLFGVPTSARRFLQLLEARAPEIGALMRRRATQTNEPGRCAVLLPILSSIRRPIALIEVGASAGLCLLPDRYAYLVNGRAIGRRDGMRPEFHCQYSQWDGNPFPTAALPSGLPDIAWRAGLDQHPLSARSKPDRDWLMALIWPEHRARRRNLRRALAIARARPPLLNTGDVATELAPLLATAPSTAVPVVFHSAVLAYCNTETRAAFRATMAAFDGIWISNEHPSVFPDLAARSPHPPPADRFLLCVNGQPVGFTGPHGQSLAWIADFAPFATGDW